MKSALTTFSLQTKNKKRLITTYRNNLQGQQLREKHQLDLQQLVANFNLNYNYAFAYMPQQSIKKLVLKHQANSYFYCFDIEAFFPSIDHQILLLKLGDNQTMRNLIKEASAYREQGLALGLVPSPYLSNIYLAEFDTLITSALQKLDETIVYTRYSDDITISAQSDIDDAHLEHLINDLLAKYNLHLKPSKSRKKALLKQYDHIKILGLNIVRGQATNYITVGRKFKKATIAEEDRLRKQAMQAYIEFNQK